ncbi:cytochrome d ubiquinol oxidase subunit II [Pseudahrensia aquimaris]|uniref:Cytochrome d ubiquinol oxidase subunit II n=1 Tax=Pseudahrensia aquimaris TaxID=744461 RepID=A0ABW3FET4_9HYPH
MNLFGDPAIWLPLAFAALMGTSILIYVVLDGFDLGVGVLSPLAQDHQRDRMIASIGPFWDANETWLVLATGLLLVAFPMAHGAILTALYLPVAIMLIGLILRGVAFEFRAKARVKRKHLWDRAFFAGSLMTSLSQGFMLGLYIVGLEWTWPNILFASITAVCLTAGYAFIGAAWLIIKTENKLQAKAVRWAQLGLFGIIGGLIAVSAASPLVSPRIFDKWFTFPEVFFLAPLPIMSIALVAMLFIALKHLPDEADRWRHVPFICATALFALAFAGLAYSFYPYVVPEKITLYEAASAPESLFIILIGTMFVLPTILAYTALSYIVFRGKAQDLRYD